MGADVLLVDRPSDPRLGLGRERWYDVMLRGRNKRSVAIDLKSTEGRRLLLLRLLVEGPDILLEGFRPGVAASGSASGPRRCSLRSSRDWSMAAPPAGGRTALWRKTAGHDINYIALTGALDMIGPAGGVAGATPEPRRRLRRRSACSSP